MIELLKKIKPTHIILFALISCILYMVLFEVCFKFINKIQINAQEHKSEENDCDCKCPTFMDMLSNIKETKEPFDETGDLNNLARKTYDADVILYYASWCGYSKLFLPEWEKFEEYAKSSLPNIRVEKIRCEGGHERTCFEKGIEGYPTIVLYPANSTEITYEGERKVDDIVKFIKDNI